MNESLASMMVLIEEIASHLKADTVGDRSAARRKLERVSALSATLALMLHARRSGR